MVSEIIQELQENIRQMEMLISKQIFKVQDAEAFLKRYFNILRKMEQLEESRDNWRFKYKELNNKTENSSKAN